MKPGRILCIATLGTTLFAGCLGKNQQAKAPVPGTSAEPDKVLYAKAEEDMKHGRYSMARLGLQTLINTYPDSEYLAKAKLAIGDSYYKEGGSAGMKQAVVEYKDFITFFPFLDESAYAQMQIAMSHYRQMEKPDRDHAEAVQAEAEFQTFLEKYPNSQLRPDAEQHLREVQEVLAEGNFRVASFYYMRTAYRAAGARLIELTDRYPLYSQADQANWMLGQIYEKAEHNEIAAKYYARIVKDYPLSSLSGDAKNKLVKFGVPVPPADPTAVARMKQEQEAGRPNMVKRTMSVLKNAPDVSAAARSGAPTMTPASETGDETIGFSIQQNAAASGAKSSVGAVGNTATVETIAPGSPNALPTQPATDPAPAPTDSTQPAATSTPAAATTSTDSSGSQPAASGSTDASNSQSSNSTSTDSNQESSSKKKSGLKKLIPF